MEPVVAIQKMTVAEFRELEFDDNDQSWYELINGEVVQKSSPNPRHQEISFELSQILGSHVKNNKSGKIYYAPIDVFLDGFCCLFQLIGWQWLRGMGSRAFRRWLLRLYRHHRAIGTE